MFSQSGRVVLLVWARGEGNRGSEASHMVLGVSNQGNYIQSNADRFPFAGACEQAAHSAFINWGHLQVLDHFVTSQKEKVKREQMYCRVCCWNEIICTKHNCSICNKGFIRSLYEPIDNTCQALSNIAVFCWLSVELTKKIIINKGNGNINRLISAGVGFRRLFELEAENLCSMPHVSHNQYHREIQSSAGFFSKST